MSKSLMQTMTERAEKSFQSDVTLGNFREWEIHWFKSSSEFLKELRAEGLTNTANKVQENINFCRKYSDLFKDEGND